MSQSERGMRLTNECQVDFILITSEILDLAGLHSSFLMTRDSFLMVISQ